MCALRFLDGVTLQRPALIEHIPFARQPKTLPVVRSRAEVARFVAAVSKSLTGSAPDAPDCGTFRRLGKLD